jgi:hypothetical protein
MNTIHESAALDIVVISVLKAWVSHITQTNELLENLSDEDLKREISPGKNTGIYVLGHLTAVHDAILPLLGLGEKLYPELETPYITTPDKSGLPLHSGRELKKYWAVVNTNLLEKFQTLSSVEWLARHNAISAEDFTKEPHRNRLNVLISRTNHLASHLGQLIYLRSGTPRQ